MIANAATEPHKSQKTAGACHEQAAQAYRSGDLETLREEAAECRACPLWKDATQTVFGEGPPHARIMLVGEQPGDKEDLAGKPFVGPAGQMLDRALAGGRHRPRQGLRHQCREAFQIRAARQDPPAPEAGHAGDQGVPAMVRARTGRDQTRLVVAMGATAAQSVFGKITPINKSRGRLIDLEDGTQALVTVHPSYLLRLPDADAKAREYQRFVDDLKIAAGILNKAHAA